MIDDTDIPQSPGWWLKRLSAELVRRNTSPEWSTYALEREARPPLDLLNAYLRGEPPLPKVAEGWKVGFQRFLRMSRMNYAELVVEPTRERLVPIGFRTAAGDDENGDVEAGRIMRANDLELKFTDIFDFMLGLGDGYAIVGQPDEETGIPLITAESPRQVITAEDPATGRTVAALKIYRDDWDSTDFAHLYLDDGRVLVATKRGATSLGSVRFNPRVWDWDDAESGQLPHPVMPVVRFKNRRGMGEFEAHLSVLDRINEGILDRVVVSKIQAFRQRAVKNLPQQDEDGNDIDYSEVFAADPGSMWQVPEGVEFWESQPVDLNPIRSAIRDDVEGLAAVTRTPLHLITPDAASGSAQGAALMREGHTYKVDDRRRRGSSALSRVMGLAFKFMGDEERSDRTQIETVWRPAERFSLSEMSSAAAQAKDIIPMEAIWTDIWQYAPHEVERLRRMRARDALYAASQAVDVERQQPPGFNGQRTLDFKFEEDEEEANTEEEVAVNGAANR